MSKKLRENADYGDFVDISSEEAKRHYENAKKFVNEAETLLKNLLNEIELEE